MGLGNFVRSVVLHDQHNSFIVQSVELLAQPSLSYNDLGWFHHLLEISYFFCPMHQPAGEVYVVLEKCLQLLHRLPSLFSQEGNNGNSLPDKLFVASSHDPGPLGLWTHGLTRVQYCLIGCLFMLFGFYPPARFVNTLNTVNRLLAMTIDFTSHQNLELLTCSAAMLQQDDFVQYHAWLLACLNTHPRISGFKTLSFVYKTI